MSVGDLWRALCAIKLHDVATRKLSEEPTPMRTRNPKLPRTLDDAVLSALHRDPAHRPTASRFEEMLVRAVNGVRP